MRCLALHLSSTLFSPPSQLKRLPDPTPSPSIPLANTQKKSRILSYYISEKEILPDLFAPGHGVLAHAVPCSPLVKHTLFATFTAQTTARPLSIAFNPTCNPETILLQLQMLSATPHYSTRVLRDTSVLLAYQHSSAGCANLGRSSELRSSIQGVVCTLRMKYTQHQTVLSEQLLDCKLDVFLQKTRRKHTVFQRAHLALLPLFVVVFIMGMHST